MVRIGFSVLALLVISAASDAVAQTPDSLPAPAKSAPVERDPLPGLPHVADEPYSLYTPAQPAPPGSGAVPLPGPYFELDPQLNPPTLPSPGWFSDLELNVLASHVKNQLTNQVQVGFNAPDTVRVPSASLDVTVAPRLELGYRLPSGFGEFVLGYQCLDTHGTGTTLGPDGLASLRSRLEVNVGDFDYASREWSLWPCWDMKWRFGLRVASVFFDSRSEQPLNVALVGSGIVSQQDSNRYIGVGPHVGVEVGRRWDDCGLALVGRIDGWLGLGRLHQAFAEQSTMIGAGGLPLAGRTVDDRSQAVPELNVQVGLRWNPLEWNHASFFVGYRYEYWWNVGRNSNTPDSRGELSDQGLTLRAEFHF